MNLEATEVLMMSFRRLPPSRKGTFNIAQARTKEKYNNVILTPHHLRVFSRLVLYIKWW